jgi:hypothetical protein
MNRQPAAEPMPLDGTPPRDDRPERYKREVVQAIM